MSRTAWVGLVAGCCLLPFAGQAQENGLVAHKTLSPELAVDLAAAALESCRAADFQVAVAVVDRFGVLQVMIRDRFAGPHTPDTARRKAWTAVSFRSDTQSLVSLTAADSPQAAARDISGALMLGGGVPIEAAGSIVGGVGVSGAPGGDEDDRCARAGIDAVLERLEF
ncbi:MAG: GlcG/HbpS family heme-binding protein [Geminicoccaceae bacterium]